MFDVVLRIHAWFSRQSQAAILLIALLLVLLLGYLDYVTGFEISLSFLYIVPVAIATWYSNSKSGYVITMISVVVWITSNWAAGETYTQEIIRYWNAFTRIVVYILILLLLQEFKRALVHERMLSQTDYLTGIANSREFYQQVKLELNRMSRSKLPISLAYIDLDGFKHINDALGHKVGDQLLRTVAQTFQSTVRRTDIVGRLGGDEFAILFPNTGLRGAERIMRRVQNKFLEQMSQLQPRVTLSGGVISFLSPPDSVDTMIHEADAQMYKVKMRGKNDIVFIQHE